MNSMVSILVFLDLALRVYKKEDEIDNEELFQSLFSWILLSEYIYVVPCNKRCAFQSLFSWILLSEDAGHREVLCPDPVSILVFLDLALREGPT